MATDRLQGLNIGIAWKPPCYVASTTNLALSSTQVVDGIAVGSCERVLVKDQTDAKLNGIYIADSGPWTRARDWDGKRDAIPGTAVYVDRGAAGGGKAYIANSSATAVSIDIGSTGDDVSFDLLSLALTGVSTFSQDTLLPLATQAAWRSTDGLNVRSATALIASTDIESDAIITAKIANNAVTLAKVSTGTEGTLIAHSSTGQLVEIGVGSSGHVLTSLGAGVPPLFQVVAGGFNSLQVFSTSGTYTRPTDVSEALVFVVGGGGGGGTNGGTDRGGAGGGGGGCAIKLVSPATSETITIGSGGAASSSGGDTLFGSHCTGGGGAGGGSAIGGLAGIGSNGDMNFAGNGGGAGGGLNGAGNSGSGGGSFFGGGAQGNATLGATGSSGLAYGGGGAGGGGTGSGGPGADGVVLVLEFT